MHNPLTEARLYRTLQGIDVPTCNQLLEDLKAQKIALTNPSLLNKAILLGDILPYTILSKLIKLGAPVDKYTILCVLFSGLSNKMVINALLKKAPKNKINNEHIKNSCLPEEFKEALGQPKNLKPVSTSNALSQAYDAEQYAKKNLGFLIKKYEMDGFWGIRQQWRNEAGKLDRSMARKYW